VDKFTAERKFAFAGRDLNILQCRPELQMPNLITGNLEYLKFDILGELQQQVPGLPVESSFRKGFAAQFVLQFF